MFFSAGGITDAVVEVAAALLLATATATEAATATACVEASSSGAKYYYFCHYWCQLPIMDDVRIGFSFVNVGGATSQVSFLQGASATITVGQTNGSLTSTVPIFHYSGHRKLQSLFFFCCKTSTTTTRRGFCLVFGQASSNSCLQLTPNSISKSGSKSYFVGLVVSGLLSFFLLL